MIALQCPAGKSFQAPGVVQGPEAVTGGETAVTVL